MYIDVSNDQSRDDKSLIGIEFDPREYFVAYVPLSPRRLAKWINRQRRLEKVKKTWAISAQMHKILGKGSAKAARQSARKYGYDYIGVCGEYMNIFKVPKFEPDIPRRVDDVGFIPIAWQIGSLADLNEGLVLLKKEGDDEH